MDDSSEEGVVRPEDHPLEKPWYAVFEGAATGGLVGAALGWVISRIAKRRRAASS